MKKYFHIRRYRSYLAASFWRHWMLKSKQFARHEYTAIRLFISLITRWLTGKELNTTDKELFKKQLLNYGKLLPLVAILALPFGTFVLILVVKFIPLNLFPTAFVKFGEVPLDYSKE